MPSAKVTLKPSVGRWNAKVAFGSSERLPWERSRSTAFCRSAAAISRSRSSGEPKRTSPARMACASTMLRSGIVWRMCIVALYTSRRVCAKPARISEE